MPSERTLLLLRTYLDVIGITGYTIHTSEDAAGLLVVVDIPKENGGRIGILKGRSGRNLSILKSLLRIVGPLERIQPCLVIKLRT
jgi:hypothetical protein